MTKQISQGYDSNQNPALWWILIFLIFSCIFSSTYADISNDTETKERLFVSNKVPPGFEDLAGPQTNQVDVYFQNKSLLGALATYDYETLKFENPEQIVNKIEDLIDPDLILDALSIGLDTNTDQLCLQNVANDDCGILTPNILGIIFDESRFRVDLFIHPLQLKTKPIYSTKYLPPADNKLSTIHAFNYNLSGSDTTRDLFNAQVNSTVALGSGRLNAQSNFTNNEDFVIDEISVQKDNAGWEAEGGIFSSETNSTNFLPEQDLLGLRLKTSTNTRTDLDITQGTEIFIYLGQRSRVEVFKDNRLIDARFYEAGNQQLDTSRFPDGAYRISVVIDEGNGRERNEEYFYVRNAYLPPTNEPQMYVEVGKINEVTQDSILPETTDNYFIHAGAAVRLKENLALEAEIANTDSESMAQSGITHLAAGIQSRINFMITSESDWGVAVRENISIEKLSLNLDFRHINEGNSSDDVDDFSFVNNDFTQASSSISHTFFGGRVLWRYSHIDRSNTKKSETYSAKYVRPLIRNNKYHLGLEIEASKDSDDYLIGTQLNFTFRRQQNEFRFNPGWQTQKSDNQQDNDIIGLASWQNTVQRPSIGRLQTRAFHTREVNSDTTGISMTSETRYGYNEIELDNTRESGEDSFGYSVRSQFNLASDFKHVSMGGSRYSQSAVIVDLKGEPEGAKFEMFVDRQSAGYAEVGAKTILSLPPYETYDVRLESRTDAFVKFDEEPRIVTLYPGNVNAMQWQVERVLVLIGRAIDHEGNPIEYAKIKDAGPFASTDERGWFQVETGTVNKLTLQLRDDSRCEITLTEYDSTEDIHVFNDLICVPTDDVPPDYSPTPAQASAKTH